MLLKRIVSAACAAVLAAGCMTFSAFADAAEDDSSQIEFTFTESMTTEKMEPALSFDHEEWKDYIFMTPDADKVGLKTGWDKTTYYQGFSVKLSASSAYNDKMFLNAGMVRDADNDNELVYPEALEEDAEFVCPGIELRAESFGLSCFDGCTVIFNYKMGTDTYGKLMGDTVYVFGTNEEYKGALTTVISLTYNDLDNDNVTQYRQQILPVSTTASATRIVFEVPALSVLDSEAVCLDNIYIQLPDGKYIKNVDGFNENAQPQETIEGIQIKEKTETKDISTSEKKEESSNTVIFVVIGIVAAAVVGVVIFFIIRRKNKFY